MQASQPEQRLRRTGGHCGGGLRHPCAFAPCTPADGILAGPWAVTHIQGSAGFSQEGQPPDRVAVLVSIVCLGRQAITAPSSGCSSLPSML